MRAILVTGGGSGIGRAVAQRFAAEGWRVGLADIDQRGLAETAALLPPDRTSTHQMDVRDPAEWEHVLADFAAISDGRLDVLFNNAGVAAGGAFGEIGIEALDGEWASEGIRVRSLMPGFIDTALLTAPVTGSNRTAREAVVASGLEFTPVEVAADKAWAAVHGDRLHTLVGPTAKRLAFAARWLPGRLRRSMRRRVMR